jgi:hypothetical protein
MYVQKFVGNTMNLTEAKTRKAEKQKKRICLSANTGQQSLGAGSSQLIYLLK